ncbi:MAG: nucleotide exchange factor GrpE [Verrucomicrobiota bacterium]
MILPSDGDPPPRRKDDDDQVPPQEPENEDWWEDDGDEDEVQEPGDGPPSAHDGTVLKSTAAPGWREDLVRELVESLSDLREIEDPDDEYDPPEPPDLYTFFGELAALRNEMRRSGRRAGDAVEKTAAAFDSVQSLLKTLAPAAKKTKLPAAEPWPVETCLALVALHDVLMRTSPGNAAAASFEPLLKAAGMSRIVTEGQPFDPATMTIEEVESGGKKSGQSVLRESGAGFLRAGVLLRPARVVVSG